MLPHADVWAWAWACAMERQKIVPAATINNNDLVAVSSLLGWATTHPAGKLLASNLAEKVKLPEEKRTITREKRFRDGEIAAILLAARQASPNQKMPRAAASRRWAAWICACTGCRIQEVCWVRREDIYREGETRLINFPKTKVDIARRVPLHPALIEEGLLDFHAQAPSGYLFCGDVARKPGATRSQQEQRASELWEWIREQVTLAPSLMACGRFCGHRDWGGHDTGGGACSEDGLGVDQDRDRRLIKGPCGERGAGIARSGCAREPAGQMGEGVCR